MIRDRCHPIASQSARRAWRMNHPRCFGCGIDDTTARVLYGGWPNAVHHIIGGWSRSDEPCNFLTVCWREHKLIHGETIRVAGVALPKITLGMVLMLKYVMDYENYDGARLAALYGQALPEFEPLPEVLVKEFSRA